MIQINDVDLEGPLRAMAAQSGHSISHIARALLRIGMRAEPAAITAEIVASRRAMGRPPVLPPEQPAAHEETRDERGRRKQLELIKLADARRAKEAAQERRRKT